MSLGVLDWGVGGLFALARARARVPGLDAVYLSDAGSVPYGLQSRAALTRSVQRGVDWLVDQGATQVLVACHSGSTVLGAVHAGVAMTGVIAPETVPSGTVAVIGGQRTIRSGAWRRALAGRAVVGRIAQPLSAHVEAGRGESPECLAVLDRILAPLRGVDVVVLACTHYAALAPAIAVRVPGAAVVDPALAVADRLRLVSGHGRLRLATTGAGVALGSAADRLGVAVARVRLG